jgi:hypothetical protein
VTAFKALDVNAFLSISVFIEQSSTIHIRDRSKNRGFIGAPLFVELFNTLYCAFSVLGCVRHRQGLQVDDSHL